ncbi:MAG: 4-(cytidine 5'-diphospho)-2-C-methyl-D-erythritol kinase [Treponema sp.]|nr:4-(cytidine 5'-diphospho)-2-C-methyl-D-erythritol kinase [Treponema sp.]
MSSDIVVSAPAKVNIGLNVLPKAEGEEYHQIESIFQTIDLCDELVVRKVEKKNFCSVKCDMIELPELNTITKAYERFCELSGNEVGVEVLLKKKIPSGGGLGGGSSDAASFIKAFAELIDFDLTDIVADAVAEKVGSDVFFFLHNGLHEASLVSGRGEIVKKINARHDFHFVLIFPEVFSSTKEAYSLVDESYKAPMKNECPLFDEYEKIYSSSVENWTFINSFTSVLTEKYPVIQYALQDLKNQGALWSDMSGSGATVFGIFESLDSAKAAVALLQKKWRFCYYSGS